MKCMKCGYISFDYNSHCPRCGKDLTAEKALLGTSHLDSLPPFPAPASDGTGITPPFPPPKNLTVEDLDPPGTNCTRSNSLLLRLKEEMAPLVSQSRDLEEERIEAPLNISLEEEPDDYIEEEELEQATLIVGNSNLEGLASVVEEINQVNEPEPDFQTAGETLHKEK